MKKFVVVKLYGICVIEFDLNYYGFIILDLDYCEVVGILLMEFVDIWNKQSGVWILIYVIYGDCGVCQCILNGVVVWMC